MKDIEHLNGTSLLLQQDSKFLDYEPLDGWIFSIVTQSVIPKQLKQNFEKWSLPFLCVIHSDPFCFTYFLKILIMHYFSYNLSF